jgi:hypothetical protein
MGMRRLGGLFAAGSAEIGWEVRRLGGIITAGSAENVYS